MNMKYLKEIYLKITNKRKYYLYLINNIFENIDNIDKINLINNFGVYYDKELNNFKYYYDFELHKKVNTKTNIKDYDVKCTKLKVLIYQNKIEVYWNINNHKSVYHYVNMNKTNKPLKNKNSYSSFVDDLFLDIIKNINKHIK